MRIVSGILRGRQINPPPGFDARPTTDFAKESLFNILNNHFDFEDCDALDLFAGSGNIGFELYSRGCKSVSSVEMNPKYVQFIENCIKNFDCAGMQVIKADAYRYLKTTPRKFDIIFADPPYSKARYDNIHQAVFEKEILKTGGLLILEHNNDVDLSHLAYYRETRKYAGVQFSFFGVKSGE
ncbi:MAG: 16S rRNA (guanine(966)-N(2))-methyltransferase RsmD [Bacteroidales bacterium]|nr:16S rRNA (guanine(966)-N(2))-methyltransferase RsmD [Bacteroidales bacterium]